MKVVLNQEELKEYRIGLITQQWSPIGPVRDPEVPMFTYKRDDVLIVIDTSIIIVVPFNPGLKKYLLKNRNIITNNLILEKLVKKYNGT